MPSNIVEYFAFSLFIVNFVIGYIRGGHLEGLKYASYSGTILTLLAVSIYFMVNQDYIIQQMWNPKTHEIMFNRMPPELYGYGILLALSFLMAFAVEQYVNRKQKQKAAKLERRFKSGCTIKRPIIHAGRPNPSGH